MMFSRVALDTAPTMQMPGEVLAIPPGRYVPPDEIANTVLFLCSDLASAITGAQYVVDGARTAIGGAVTQAMQN
jgi:NAD(P)-dependent dehydrogenase (short-subunit alcohol dehydrogenase family)